MEPSKVALATACGAKKRPGKWPAPFLYQSPRITALHRRKGNWPLYILSAQYGLVHSNRVVSSYQRAMDEARARELAPEVAEVMKSYDWLVFFRAGSRQAYTHCIKLAAKLGKVPVALIGYGNMGGFRECLKIAEQLTIGQSPDRSTKSLEIYRVE